MYLSVSSVTDGLTNGQAELPKHTCIPYIVERVKIIMTKKYDQWFYYRIVAAVTFAIYMNALIRVVGDLWKLRSEDS